MQRTYSRCSIEAQQRAEQAVKYAQEVVKRNMQALEVHKAWQRVFLQQHAIDRTHHLFQAKYDELQRALEAEKMQPQTRVHKLKVALLHEKAQCVGIEAVPWVEDLGLFKAG